MDPTFLPEGPLLLRQIQDADLRVVTERPLYARTAKDNVASLRVLEKCGFSICEEDRDFSNARGEEVDEFVLMRN